MSLWPGCSYYAIPNSLWKVQYLRDKRLCHNQQKCDTDMRNKKLLNYLQSDLTLVEWFDCS